ncbi:MULTISPECIES: MBOAT family protein [unclassified Treponema]|uniref:MBOAT family O-acyltransferase n=1 Tax=unclassified Treponema TaxID=2638727 RepID=UPI0020A544B2|nr:MULTISPECIES: MBOAT family O-acyltransferase [unclassified Treponema]UTC67789.1 MBOAT family protein [Treponema sp. OMZ 789]UTC70514.1 MBOAT family protein [Treponema sp. OMZ 790]UTC73226.1 MBOAT family protein [Treponema sp. OMZ 791]
MFFPTISFAVFFLSVFFLYWYVFRQEKERKILLTAASYFFYAMWDWRFCILLFIFTLVNYFYGFLLDKEKNYAPRKAIVIIICVLDILYLGFFKYLYGLLSYLNQFFPGMYEASPFLAWSLLIPVGISYYTFRCMSYVFDIYLCKIRHVKSFWDLLLYVSFFPQLSSGPIVQAEYFFKDLPRALNCDNEKGVKPIAFDHAIVLLISGLYKKMIISNFLTILVTDKIFANPSFYNTWELIFGVLCYTIIIYADFSGYTDMAIGIGILLGFNTPANFNRPYLSKSITEFWRRWHISFSSWLRDYLYFGLGGSRFGLARTLFALFFTMVIAGFWHGASWTFLIWGTMQGTMLCIEKIISEKKKAMFLEEEVSVPKNKLNRIAFLKILSVFIFINISWLVFFSPSLSELGLYLKSLGNISKPFQIIRPFILLVFFAGLILQLPSENLRKKAFTIYNRLPMIIKVVITVSFLSVLYTVSTSGIPPFIYFAF